MSPADLLGLAGSVLSVVLWWPQALRTWRMRHDPQSLVCLSATTQLLVVVNALVWAFYAVQTGAFWSGVPGLVNLPLAGWTAWHVSRARRLVAARAPV